MLFWLIYFGGVENKILDDLCFFLKYKFYLRELDNCGYIYIIFVYLRRKVL